MRGSRLRGFGRGLGCSFGSIGGVWWCFGLGRGGRGGRVWRFGGLFSFFFLLPGDYLAIRRRLIRELRDWLAGWLADTD